MQNYNLFALCALLAADVFAACQLLEIQMKYTGNIDHSSSHYLSTIYRVISMYY